MNNTMKAGIFAAVIVLFASFAMLAVPVSAEGDGTETVEMKEMTAEDFLSLADDGKIVMSGDVKLTSALVITGTIELDLNGYKLVNGGAYDTIAVSEGGKLTVNDSKTGGIVDNVNHGKTALTVKTGGEAILNGGTFERSKETALKINDADVSNANSWYTIWNDGTLTINKGVAVKNYVLKSGEKLGNASSLIINGKNADATLTINGGTFEGGLYIKNEVKGVATINDGTFRGIASWTLFNYNEMTINGGTFVGNKGIVRNGDTNVNPIKLTITGGNFTWGENGNVDQGLVDIYPSTQKSHTYNVTVTGIAVGKNVFTAENGEVITGTFSVNGQKVELKDIKAGEGFKLAVGSIDIEGAYTSDAADGSITVNGDAKLSGTIDSTVTVKVASGSITVPEGKTLTGTIQMGEKNSVTVSRITAGKNGLTVTPSTIGGSASASESGSIAIAGTVSVASALTLDKVTVTVPEKSELSVPKGASISGGEVSNAGTLKVDGAVQSHVDNSGTVSAAVDAEISDVDGEGTVNQPKPVIVKKVFDKEIRLGETVLLYVDVTEGADVKITGVSWASYKDGCISGTPSQIGEFKITATPFIGDNVGESVTFTINVTAAPAPVDPVEPEKEKEGGISAAFILMIVILLALAVFAVTRFI